MSGVGDSPAAQLDDEDGISLLDLAVPLAESWRLLLLGPLVVGAAALALTYTATPIFTARAAFIPPQPQQSSAASALASLGALTGLAGIGAVRTPADQYVALLQSTTVEDRLIDQFKLMEVYDAKFRIDARKTLEQRVKISVGKKDGLISVEVDDVSPQRAAAIANRHVEELRLMTLNLVLTEAQQRRRFFEIQLSQTRERLTQAQLALQASGFTAGALRAEPRAAAEGYARLKAEVTAAEVRLQTLRRSFTDNSPEVQQQQTTVAALRGQLARLEASEGPAAGPDYVSKFREFKYQETLFDLFAKQYELARLDESQEGALIQVVDAATAPEKKSKPARLITAIAATIMAAVGLLGFVWIRHRWRQSKLDPTAAGKIARLRLALQGR